MNNMGESMQCFSAKTYIEKRFYQCCETSIRGEVLWSNWTHNKMQYVRLTQTTIYEFMHFSLHDASHSVNILHNIERILGRARVDQLTLGDLWLILNAAYAHDIGMVSDYTDLSCLWKDESFLGFLQESEESSDQDLQTAVIRLKSFDGYVRLCEGYTDQDTAKKSMNWKDIDCWPIEFRRDVTYIMAAYNRKMHGSRSRSYFEKVLGINDLQEEERLFRLLGLICEQHTQDIEKILDLERTENGFEIDDIHPQLVSILLRLADSLDIDNNRFDMFSIRHFGTLPYISAVHFKKHKTITHFLIHSDMIKITAESDDFDVCKIHQTWFEMVEQNIKFMIYHWKDMVPAELTGCYMGLPELKIYHKGNPFKSNFGRDFQMDKKKLLKLFVGNNLYSTKLDFLRELVQNALDANRIALFLEISQKGKKEFYLKEPEMDETGLKPFDLKKQAFDNFPVEIIVSECIDHEGKRDPSRFNLTVKDVGIGVDEEGVDVIAHIGLGWRERSNFTAVINRMRQWMRPTGGFGVGIQSAFLVTDKIEMKTKADGNIAYKITMQQKGALNDIVVEYDRSDVKRGSEINLSIAFDAFDDDNFLRKYGFDEKRVENDWDYFNYSDRLDMIHQIICAYSSKFFINSLMPVKVCLQNGTVTKKHVIQSKYFFMGDDEAVMPDYFQADDDMQGFCETRERMCSVQKESGGKNADEEYALIREFYSEFGKLIGDDVVSENRLYLRFEMGSKALRIWDDSTETFYYLQINPEQKGNLLANYKNVRVDKNCSDHPSGEKESNIESAGITDILFDVLGQKVHECLIVSRNEFLADAMEKGLRLRQYERAYINMLSHILESSQTVDAKNWFLIYVISCCSGLDHSGISIPNVLESQFHTDRLDVCVYQKKKSGEESPEGKSDTEYQWSPAKIFYSEIIEKVMKQTITLAVADSRENDVSDNFDIDTEEKKNKWHAFCSSVCIITDDNLSAILRYFCDCCPVLSIPSEYSKDMKIKAFRVLNENSNPYDEWKKNSNEHNGEKSSATEEKRVLSGKGRTVSDGEKADHIVCDKRQFLDGDNTQYKRVAVKRLPYVRQESKKNYYISPYNEAIGRQIKKYRDLAKRNGNPDDEPTIRKIMNERDFIKMVTDDESFAQLCDWVYKNQIIDDQYDVGQIRDAYISILKSDFRKL